MLFKEAMHGSSSSRTLESHELNRHGNSNTRPELSKERFYFLIVFNLNVIRFIYLRLNAVCVVAVAPVVKFSPIFFIIGSQAVLGLEVAFPAIQEFIPVLEASAPV